MSYSQFRSFNLPRPTLSTQLTSCLNHQKNTPHSWVVRGQSTTIRINRQLPTQGNTSALHKLATFSLFAKPQVFKEEQYRNGKRIIDHSHVDVAWGHTCLGKCAWGRNSRCGNSQIGHLRNVCMGMALATAKH